MWFFETQIVGYTAQYRMISHILLIHFVGCILYPKDGKQLGKNERLSWFIEFHEVLGFWDF
jgi:hypothetical protein